MRHVVRVARAAAPDHDAVGELLVTSYRIVFDELGDYEDELRDTAHHQAHGEVYVVRDGGHVVGTVTLVPGGGDLDEWHDPDAAGIRFLAVAPDARGRGIGAALVEHCIQRSRELGKRRVLLHTTDRMTVAQRLYERLGFVRERHFDWEPEAGFWLRGYRLEIETDRPAAPAAPNMPNSRVSSVTRNAGERT